MFNINGFGTFLVKKPAFYIRAVIKKLESDVYVSIGIVKDNSFNSIDGKNIHCNFDIYSQYHIELVDGDIMSVLDNEDLIKFIDNTASFISHVNKLNTHELLKKYLYVTLSNLADVFEISVNE